MSEVAVSRASGRWAGSWEVRLRPWDGPDFSRTCFLFVGQGATTPGMFVEQYRAGGPLRDRFDQADAWARTVGLSPVSSYLTDPGQLAGETLVRIRNLALCTAEVGLFDRALAGGLRPRLLTGFSLGEFPALCCAGALDLPTMLRLVLARDAACDPANQLGYLVAVAAGPSAIEAQLHDLPYQVSNRNSPGQTAIAVAPRDLVEVAARLRAHDLRFKVLEYVPQPYHSASMQAAAGRYRQWLGQYPPVCGATTVALLSSVTRQRYEAGELDAATLVAILGQQLLAPVDFIDQVETAYANRCYAFVEIGPGAALSGFARDILGQRPHRIVTLEAMDGVAAGAAQAAPPVAAIVQESAFARRLLDRVRRAIARATGYDIVSITVEDRFQEDLGIDSIKKADILFSVVREDPDLALEYDASAVRRIADVVAALTPSSAATQPLRRVPADFRRLVHGWRAAGIASQFLRGPVASVGTISVDDLLSNPAAAVAVLAGLERVVIRADGPVAGLSDQPAAVAIARLAPGLGAWKFLAELTRDVELCLVTDDSTPAVLAGLPVFFRSLRKEQPRLFIRHLSFDRVPPAQQLAQAIDAEFRCASDADVRFAGSRRLLPQLRSVAEADDLAGPGADCVVLAIGGARGTLLALLLRLDLATGTRLFVAGRSEPETVEQALADLRGRGFLVDYCRLDATDATAVARLVEQIRTGCGRLDLVLNAAGQEHSALLAAKPCAAIESELAAKVLPVAHLLAALGTCGSTRVLSFSSIVGHWGNPGQTIYACANAIIEALTVDYNRACGRRQAVAIQWPPWNAVGMTAVESVRHRLERAGIALLDAERAAALLSRDLSAPGADVVQYGDRADDAFFAAGLRDHRDVRPVIGNPSAAGGFERTLATDSDPWLADHAVDGTAVVPAAVMMTMAVCAARQCDDGIDSLRDFAILRPIQVRTEPVDVRIELAGDAPGLRLRLRSQAIHAECVALRQPVTGGLRCDGSRPAMPGYPFGPMPYYRDGALFHGPAFRMLQALDFPAPDRVVAGIDTRRLPSLAGVPTWDRLSLWLDGALQALALVVLRHHRVLALPVAVASLHCRFAAFDSQRVRVDAVMTGRGDNRVRGDINLFADDGYPLLRLTGVELAEIRPAGSGSPP